MTIPVHVTFKGLAPRADVDALIQTALRAIRPGGTVSSLGVYSGKLVAPYEAIHAGLGDQRIVTTLCPGGKERMRRLMAMIEHHRVDLSPLVTHRFGLDRIQDAFDLFSAQGEGVLKVALRPGVAVTEPEQALACAFEPALKPAG